MSERGPGSPGLFGQQGRLQQHRNQQGFDERQQHGEHDHRLRFEQHDQLLLGDHRQLRVLGLQLSGGLHREHVEQQRRHQRHQLGQHLQRHGEHGLVELRLAFPDGGASVCDVDAGEFCISFTGYPDGGASPSGICTTSCSSFFGEPCPGDSVCLTIDSQGDQACFADCNAGNDTASCPDSLACNALSPNPADQAVCLPVCTTAADCNGSSGTHEICSHGVCGCTTDTDCNGGATDAGPGSEVCDILNGTCYVPCSGLTDYTTCANSTGGCCGQIGDVSYCNSTGQPNRPLCAPCSLSTDCTSSVCDAQSFCNIAGSCVADSTLCSEATTDGGWGCDAANTQCVCPNEIAQQGLCGTCTQAIGCVSGNCDSLGFCNLASSDLCSQDTAACAAVSGATCDAVTDNCTCPGEANITDAGACSSLYFNPFNNGDIGQPCIAFVDGGGTVCDIADGESCQPLTTDGGISGPGYCTMTECFPGFIPCPASALCNGAQVCVAQCNVVDGGGCFAPLTCAPQSPNPADPGVCQPPQCASNSDCNVGGSGTAEVCTHGFCACTLDSDCNGGVDAGSLTERCDAVSGTCYQPCATDKACGGSGCCESAGAVDYCNVNGAATAAPLVATCGSCRTNADCSTGYCDSAGRCNVPDLCSATPSECSFLDNSTCVHDNCSCGEADAGPLGGACYVVAPVPGSGGNMDAPCVLFPDAGASVCNVAGGEFCTTADGNPGAGFCALDCASGQTCPTGSFCTGVGNGDAWCLKDCHRETDGGAAGCNPASTCVPLSINPVDPAVCYFSECATTTDCTNNFGTGFVCGGGVCNCSTNDACSTVYGTGYACDHSSGQCYLGCAENKFCGVNTGGCCAEYNSTFYCDPSGVSLPDGG